MARKFETGIIITGDGKGGVRAIKANREELDRFDRQSRQTRGSTERLSASWGEARRMAVSFAGAVGLSTAGFAAMVARQANAARENAALADSLGVSTQRLQEWQYAGMSVGVEADKVGDIFKDVSDKLGDFVRTGGGEAADLFEQLNLNTSELIQMSPDQQLLAIGQALSQLTNQGEKVFFLESIADDASRLMPLLEDNAAGLKAAAQEARDFGYALDEDQNRALVDAGNGLTRLTGFAEGFANRLTIAVAPAISRTTDNLDELNTIVSDPAFQSALNDLANIGAKMAQGLAKGSLQFLQQIGSIDDKLRVWASDQFGIGDDFSVDLSRSHALRTEIDYLQTLANGNWFDRIGNGYASLEAVNEKLAEKQAELATVNGNVFDSFGALVAGIGDASGAARNHAAATNEDSAAMDGLAGALKPLLTAYDADHTKRQQLIADRKTLTDALDKEPEKAEAIRRAIAEIDDQLKKLNGTQKQTQSEAQKAAEQLQQRYESTRASMAQQIALMGQVGQAAQVRYDTEFGELRKISAERKKALIDQATELDMLQRKQDLLDSFVQSSSLSGLFDQRDQAQQIGGATGRIAERNVGKAITDQAREGAPQVQGLDAQYSGPFGEANRIERERAQLQAWYAERIAMYEDFKQLEADKADEYNAVITGLERDRASQMLSIDQQVQQARLAGYSTLFGDLADLSKTFAGEQSGIYQTLFAAEKSYSIASTLASSYTAIAKAWASAPFPVNLPAVAAATIETGALTAAVQGLSLAGQAHDGIDSIPADGTWNLQKNERVVDRRTNADLKQYLDRANARSQTNAGGTSSGSEARTVVTNTFHIQGQVDEATLQRIEQAEENAYRRVFQDAKTNGPIRRQLRV